MSAIAKDQMQRFTPEQQETLGTLEAIRVKKRQDLLEQARHYRGQQWLAPLFVAIFFLVAVFATQKIAPYLVGISLWVLIQFHAAGVNRRLDALVAQLAEDTKGGDDET